MVNWISLIGAAGIGAIIIKILDIVWLQKIYDRSEQKKWLRNQKMKAFSEFSEALLSLGLGENLKIGKNPYEFYSLSSVTILLLENDNLVNKIDRFIINWDKLINENLSKEESDMIYYNLIKNSKTIVKELRNNLIKR